ncbi:hypothetical protein M885DRAFT_626848 [Pelagophyceae sp. CCMP2097]|nr:hypothetical protein M885DRAFT_626848 [Pelagophyceae sp. CCMP2097]
MFASSVRRLALAARRRALSTTVIVVPMPMLSPTCTHGAVERWLVKPGDEVVSYGLIAELVAEDLTEGLVEVGGGSPSDGARRQLMEFEAHEEGILAAILVHPGARVAVGTPIAVIADSADEVADALSAYAKATITDVYNQDLPAGFRTMTWQAYVKDQPKPEAEPKYFFS